MDKKTEKIIFVSLVTLAGLSITAALSAVLAIRDLNSKEFSKELSKSLQEGFEELEGIL